MSKLILNHAVKNRGIIGPTFNQQIQKIKITDQSADILLRKDLFKYSIFFQHFVECLEKFTRLTSIPTSNPF